jgi:predicted transcriptional regulator of viral defense system
MITCVKFMKTNEFLAEIDRVDRMGIWALTLPNLRIMFPEPLKTFRKSLGRMERLGLVVRVARGIYLNPRARSLPLDLLSVLVSFLRPWCFNYLSLESALSEAGIISQMPSRLTVMTTGRKGVFETPYGIIEFVHTSRSEDEILKEVNYDSFREIYVATPQRAERDLRRVGRNTGLIQHQE